MPKKTATKSFPISPVLPAPVARPQLDQARALQVYQETFRKIANVFYKLVALAKQGHGGPSHPTPQPWVVADRLDQDALFAIQQKFADLLGEMAFTLGPQFEKNLLIELPYLFTQSDSKAG
jgi:hypothetical protein